jgi:hypothetical protein
VDYCTLRKTAEAWKELVSVSFLTWVDERTSPDVPDSLFDVFFPGEQALLKAGCS